MEQDLTGSSVNSRLGARGTYLGGKFYAFFNFVRLSCVFFWGVRFGSGIPPRG